MLSLNIASLDRTSSGFPPLARMISLSCSMRFTSFWWERLNTLSKTRKNVFLRSFTERFDVGFFAVSANGYILFFCLACALCLRFSSRQYSRNSAECSNNFSVSMTLAISRLTIEKQNNNCKKCQVRGWKRKKVTAEKGQATVWQNSRKRIRRQFLGLLRLWNQIKGRKRKMH